ncbi:MAG: L-glutamyl-[BtrI acyl-carrier protein] decarboxylase [Promethearchaeota archaeon]|nr:MAG: L-glutamyl-[BtrI acyl-carrier protein] decarboxylase [Candidatus Lokiarchaeota archaeon]
MKEIAGNTYIRQDNEDIFIDSYHLHELIDLFDTPLMIFIENRIRDNIRDFNDVFGNIFETYEGFYSLKANYLPSICNIISSERMGGEIISLPELKVALNAGFSPERIIVGGPYLPDDLIEISLKHSIKELIIYNLEDLERVQEIAEKHHIIQNICLRINSMKYESKLGIKITDTNANRIETAFSKCSNLKFTTLLSHYGTQMNHVNQFLENLDTIINAIKILKKHGIEIKRINIGGGFPEATVMPKKQLIRIAKALNASLQNKDINIEKIYVEPGRYIVGDSGIFIANVIKIAKNRWVFLNIGNHICPKFARCSLRFYNVSKIDASHKYKTNLAGIIPTDQDVLAKDYFFTEQVELYDKVLVTNVGAYCLTFSNRFPYRLPTIINIKGDEYEEIFNPANQHDFSI